MIKSLIKLFFTVLFTFLFIFVFISIGIFFISRMGISHNPIKENSVGVIKISGIIRSSEKPIEQLDDFGKNKKIKAIILKINSPGGAVVPSQEIYREILKVKKEKPVYAYCQSVAASGAYYIASACNKIIANPGTITGSIGVILEFTNFKQLADKLGIKAIVIKSGKFKDVGNPFRPVTSEERNLLNNVVLNIYNQFLSSVSKSRHIPIGQLRQIADGRIFSGEQALKYKLVDTLGNFSDLINIIKKDCKLKKEPAIVYPEEEKPLIKKIIDDSEKTFINIIEEKMFMLNYILK